MVLSSQVTSIASVVVTPAGPYIPGQTLTVTVTTNGSHSSVYNVPIRIQDTIGFTQICHTNRILASMEAGATTLTAELTIPANGKYQAGAPTSLTPTCTTTNITSGFYIRAFIAQNAAGNSNELFGYTTPLVLPIELTNFSSEIVYNGVALHWQTASESNNHYFEIQRSSEGEIFVPLGKVEGAGNSNTTQNYSFEDPRPLSGLSYYRLKQVDYDDAHAFSKMITVDNNKDATNTLSLYPSIATRGEQINFQLPKSKEETLTLEVFDITGRMVEKIAIHQKDTNFRLSTESLQKGNYFVRVTNGGDYSYTNKFSIY
jgi:hypothetical protein